MPDLSFLLNFILLPMLVGYLVGSIPFGLVVTRAAGLGDIRAIGSGNIGATNVLRTGHKGLAALTLALDMLKGTVAVALAGIAFGPTSALCAGLAAFLGHLFPVWLGFKGGKGVATFIGVLAGLAWPAALAFCGVWLLTAAVTRTSSLAALLASLAAPFALLWLGDWAMAVIGAIMVALIYWKHSANIARLLAGTEPRIGEKA